MNTRDLNLYTAQAAYGATSLSSDIDAVSGASPSIHEDPKIQAQAECGEYGDIVNVKTDKILKSYGLEPQSTEPQRGAKQEKKYTEGGFECIKYKNTDGTYTIIKQTPQTLGSILYDTLAGTSPETIVETYNSKNKLTKTTHYDTNRDYTVQKYENGTLTSQAEVKHKDPNSWNNYTYTSSISIKEYDWDKSYLQTDIKCSYNYENEENHPNVEYTLTYYKKNGKIDWGKQLATDAVTLLTAATLAAIADTIEET